METILGPVTSGRPSWAGNPGKLVDLLLSDSPWKFEAEEQVEQERNVDHFHDEQI